MIDLTKCICDTYTYNTTKVCKFAYGIGTCPFNSSNKNKPEYKEFFKLIKEGIPN